MVQDESAQSQLPEIVAKNLQQFVSAAKESLGPDLCSIVLYGSAAEGRLRATSDVNLLLVLAAWNPARLDAIREPLRNAHAAIALSAMFVVEGELPAVAEAFAVKFADIMHRRRILSGSDPFAGLSISRPAEITRLRQVLLNLLMRMRERYLSVSLREEQAARVLAQVSGPLRASAAALLELSGKPASSPKAALETVAAGVPGSGWKEALSALSQVREGQALPKGVAPETLLRLIDLTAALCKQVQKLV
jgi:predicted nucleotidyltransferase